MNTTNTFSPAVTESCEPYIEPEELAGPILRDTLPFEAQVLEEIHKGGTTCKELQFLSEIYNGEKIFMHAWLCHPSRESATPSDQQPTRLPAILSIPGGLGISDKEGQCFIATQCEALVLGVDWIGSGKSSRIPEFDPWANAMRFHGDDYRRSYQYHNLRALLRATNFLLSQPLADDNMLIALGGSWGGFYSWLLAGLDQRFKYIFPTFGCGFLDTECSQVWESYFASMGREKAEIWLRAFDPGRRAHLIKAHVFFQQATNDKFYSLLPSMKSYRRLRGQRSLLLICNQDHFLEPYVGEDIKRIQYVLNLCDEAPPVIHAANWLTGTNFVEVLAKDPEHLDLSVVYSAGNYTKSFGRRWRTSPVMWRDGRWLAEIPVVDIEREIWFYAHANTLAQGDGDGEMGTSTPVQSVVPAQMGLDDSTAEFDPTFDFSSESFWNLPVGDRQHPTMRLVTEDGIAGLAMRFTSDETRRGVAYCLEGDLIAKEGYNALEVLVKVSNQSDLHGLKLVLVTDFHTLAEQTYGVDLESYHRDFHTYQLLQIPFADFKPYLHRHYWFWEPAVLPMNVERLCGVGFYRSDCDYRGEAIMAKIRVVRMDGAIKVPLPPPHVDAWPPHEARLNDPDPLANAGQGDLLQINYAPFHEISVTRRARRRLRSAHYRQLIQKIRDVARTTLPADAKVIVISKGDEELLKLHGRRAWHFPQTEDGVYAGFYPADSDAAIDQLEALKARGADFLLVPETGKWWLEHYEGFRKHLERHYREVLSKEAACLIFALNPMNNSSVDL